MKFQDKNDFIVKNTSAQHFEKDLQLFKKHCPKSRLHSELNRVNSFTRKKLDGYMLNELLDKITVDEILKNRGVKTGSRNKNISPPTGSPAPPAPDKGMNPLASNSPAPSPPAPSVPPVPPAPDNKKLEALEQRIKTFENLEKRIKVLEASWEYTEDEISGLKELQEQISDLEESQDDAASDISDLQDALNEKDTLIAQLQAKIEELEKKTVKKKDETG